MSVFEELDRDRAHEAEEVARAVIAFDARYEQRFAKYVAGATSDEEREARLAIISDDVDKLVSEVANEYIVTAGGHASGCECGFCKNKGKLPGSDKSDSDDDTSDDDDSSDDSKDDKKDDKPEWLSKSASYDAMWHTAAGPEVETGDHYQQERQSVDEGPDASPKIDKGSAGDQHGNSGKDIDVGSKRNRLERQDADTEADYNADAFDKDSPVRERVDVEKSIGPQDTGRTKQWTGEGNQADPVTSATDSKWTIVSG